METRKRILEAAWHLLEATPHEEVHMRDIAKEAGISRQALYLHFDSRVKLLIAVVQYVDEVKGLNERMRPFQSAETGLELLEACVDVWGNYIPEIYGIAIALVNTRKTDEAAAAAWDGCMSHLREICAQIIDKLMQEERLREDWSRAEALEVLWVHISIQSWEQFVMERGFTTEQFIRTAKKVLKRSLLEPEPA